MDLYAPSGVVTPEAVRLEFEPANVGTRGVAFLIDLTLMTVTLWILAIAGSIAATSISGVPSWVAIVLTLVLTFGVFWGYPIAMETLWRGRTLGKAAMGLRAVTDEGAPVRFRHASVRAILGLVDFLILFGFVAVVSSLVTARNQRLGDLVAGTIVVRERTGAAQQATAATFAVPAGAEAYAATIEVAGLSAAEYHTARQFLLRAGELDPALRDDLARRVAAPLAQRVNHTPPQGVPPELFLLCLAARYQQRWASSAQPAPVAAPPPPAEQPVARPTGDGGFAPPT